jgi:hypothetical protein
LGGKKNPWSASCTRWKLLKGGWVSPEQG